MYLHEAPKASDATALAVKVQNSRLVKSVRRTLAKLATLLQIDVV